MLKNPDTDQAVHIPHLQEESQATTQEEVYLRLRNAVMVGSIPPGTALTMRGLAAALGVSATPIREAMRRLSSEAAVLEQSNRRFKIPEMESGRFADLVETRIALECHAAQRALPHVSTFAIGRLVELDTQMDSSFGKGEYDGLTRLNQDFHRMLYQLNPNHAALPLIESMWLQLGPFQRQVIDDIKEFYVVDRHKEIILALETRNATKLVEAITKDIQDGIGRAGRAALQG